MKCLNNSLFVVSLVLSACGNPSDQKDVANKSDGDNLPSTSVSIPSLSGSASAKELPVINESVVYSKKNVIVNAANQWLAPGGVLSGAIFSAAGADKIFAEIASKHGGISNANMSGTSLLKTSEVFTTGAYDLSKQGTQYIIHALGPDFTIAPYNGNVELGYADLRKTYENLYAEMHRLNKSYNVTSLGIIPISSGVFAGAANLTKLYQIMIDETLAAMQKYPALQPELYVFGKGEFDAVKAILKSTINPSSTVSLGIVSQASKLALLDSPTYVGNLGTVSVQGAAISTGSLRIMGGVVDSVNERLMHLTVGTMNRGSFFGCELETIWSVQEFSHYAIKAINIVQISDSLKLAGGAGYSCEHTDALLPKNIRQFIYNFGIDASEFQRHGIVGDINAQYNIPISSTVSIATTVGLRATYSQTFQMNPFAHVICQFSGFNVAAAVSQTDMGFNIHITP